MTTGLCDRIVELTFEGEKKIIYTISDDFRHRAYDHEWCHSNAISYSPETDFYYLSILTLNCIIAVSRDGALQFVLGGEDSDFETDLWRKQHGHHVFDDRILFFNNGGNDDTNNALALELQLDEKNGIAETVWDYNGDAQSLTQGDVQRLSNGNTLVVYSAAGEWHEVDPEGNRIKQVNWPVGGVTGYAVFREYLYGPPPK